MRESEEKLEKVAKRGEKWGKSGEKVGKFVHKIDGGEHFG